MKKNIHPQVNNVTTICASCKTSFEIMTTSHNLKIEICSNCHPFYTGNQTIIDTANKVKDFERRKNIAAETHIKNSKKVKKEKTTEIKGQKPLTLRDMLKSIQA